VLDEAPSYPTDPGASGEPSGYRAHGSGEPVLVPPSQGIRVTMPTSISRNNASGGGIGKVKDNECVVQ
jgi:hypothetical protein